MSNILLIPHIKIHNANALSSPYTIGFPAMTAWLGGTHALERLLKEQYPDIEFNGMAVVCHDIDLQTYKGDSDYVHSIVGTGNPLDKHGNRPSFIEEARAHLTVSLVIDYQTSPAIRPNDLTTAIDKLMLSKMKLAGGDIISCHTSESIEIDDDHALKKLLRRLMPGHCLIERRDLMTATMQEGQDAIDALLDYLKVTHHCDIDDKQKVTWSSSRKEKGWIVPIATGFHGITELGKAENQRDINYPHRFAESVVTLGEFVMPYRIAELDDMLWHYLPDLENNLYLCQQKHPINEL